MLRRHTGLISVGGGADLERAVEQEELSKPPSANTPQGTFFCNTSCLCYHSLIQFNCNDLLSYTVSRCIANVSDN